MKEPIWWLKKTKPPSMNKCATPNIYATVALVGGMEESRSRPITLEDTYTLADVSETSKTG